jgi:hypothetical protein
VPVLTLYTDKCNVYALEQTLTEANEVQLTPKATPAITDLRCNIQPLSAEEANANQIHDIEANYKVFTDMDLDALLPETGGLTVNYILVKGVVTYAVKAVVKREQTAFNNPLQYKILVFRRIT